MYPLALILRRKGNWLHVGSIPIIPTHCDELDWLIGHADTVGSERNKVGSIPIVTTMIEKIIEAFKDAGVSKDKTLEILHKILNTPNIDTEKVDIILVKELSIDEYLLLKNTFIF